MRTISAVLLLAASTTVLAQGVPENIQARDDQHIPKWPKKYDGFKHGRYDALKPKEGDWHDRRDVNDDYKHPAQQYEYKPEKDEKKPEGYEKKPEKYDDKKEQKKEKKPEKYEKKKKPQSYQSGKDHDKRDPIADGPDNHDNPDDFDEQGERRGGGWRNAGGRTTAPVIGGVLGLVVVMAALL